MQAKIDENRIPTLLAVLNTDGVTPNLIYVNPAGHGLKIVDDTTGNDYGNHVAARDENRKVVAMAVSSADGVTPINLYSDNLYNLLIKST